MSSFCKYHTFPQKCVYLIVDVDDIVITKNDATWISQLMEHLSKYFQIKNLGCLKNFLGIEVTQSKESVAISQRNYALNILKDAGMIDGRPVDSPTNLNKNVMTK